MTGLTRRRPLPDGQPVLPHVRAQGRDPRLRRRRRDDAPRAGVRRRPRRWPGSAEERVTVLPGAPTLYQSILDHPDRDGHDLSSLRVAVTGAADIPVELIRRIRDELPFSDDHHRLRAHRGGHGRPPPRPDDDLETIATTVGRPAPGLRGAHRRRQGRTTCRRASPARSLVRGGSIMSRYLDDPEATAAALVRRRLAAHRRPRRRRRRRLPADRRPDQGHVHRRRLQRLPGRDRERAAAPPRHPAGRGDRHPRRAPRRGRAWRSSCSRPARRRRPPTRSSRGAATQMANYKVPRAVEIVDELPLNATGKVEKDVLRDRVAAATPASTT